MPPVGTPVDISVVIPAFNAASTIGAQLDALCRQDVERRMEIVVADNGSSDATQMLVEDMAAGPVEIRWVDASDRRGAAHARNVGAAAAQGTLLLFCDADDVADRSWVRFMAAALDHHDGVGGYLETHAINRPRLARMRRSPTDRGLPDAFGRWPVPIGASCGIHAKWFDELGGFDERFPAAGGEDTDLFIRLQLAGGDIGWVREAIMHYRFRPGLKEMWRQAEVYGRANSELYARFRHEGLPSISPFVLAKDLLWMATCLVTAPFSRRQRGELVWWVAHTTGQIRQSRTTKVLWIG